MEARTRCSLRKMRRPLCCPCFVLLAAVNIDLIIWMTSLLPVRKCYNGLIAKRWLAENDSARQQAYRSSQLAER